MSAKHNYGLPSLPPLAAASASFGGRDATIQDPEQAKVLIIPVPYDATTTYISGTREGPAAILRASQQLELFDDETGMEVFRVGIATLEEIEVDVSSPQAMVAKIRSIGEDTLAAGLFPLILGGEHLLSLGMIQALAGGVDDLSILQLDAHADLRQNYQGTEYSNACITRLASRYAKLVPVGIRSLSLEENHWAQEQQLPIFYAADIYNREGWQQEVVEHLRPRVYISIDLDVFDPAIMPAVGTPEPGGLHWYEVLELLRLVCQTRQVVGADIMELCPQPGNIAPDFFAAKLAYKLLSYRFESERQQG
ncbi:MAG: agmatinase [Deltaproteobacteria bacterium]|nr:agmatinase [Deltaproteobacteria bacterium]